MKIYKIDDVRKAIKSVGIKKGDAVFIFPETYKFGILENIEFHHKVYESFYKIISEIIGPKGTICIQSHTFNTLRFNFKSSDQTLPDSKKLNTDIWYDDKTNLWVKAAFDKTGYWEYRIKIYK